MLVILEVEVLVILEVEVLVNSHQPVTSFVTSFLKSASA
jgi:hypothetical protein